MRLYTSRLLNNNQQAQLMQLWNKEYPEQLAYHELSEFRSYLDGLANVMHFLLIDNHELIKAWAFTFTREAERWFAIILDSSVQYQGYGTSLLNTLKTKEQILCGWVTDHNRYVKKDQTNYRSPLDFYLKNNFTICDQVRLETDKLSAAKIQWKSINVQSQET
ncbi:MAG: N-acetyltransferase [Taibaiella sp.]